MLGSNLETFGIDQLIGIGQLIREKTVADEKLYLSHCLVNAGFILSTLNSDEVCSSDIVGSYYIMPTVIFVNEINLTWSWTGSCDILIIFRSSCLDISLAVEDFNKRIFFIWNVNLIYSLVPANNFLPLNEFG